MRRPVQPKDPGRILAIGMDSADYHLIQKWMDMGRLPVLTSLAKRGSIQSLTSTADMGSGTVWPSFFTGTFPAKHNGFFSRRLENGTYRLMFKPEPYRLRRDPFWVPLCRAGKRMVVLDVPKTYPVKEVSGIQLSAWGAHSPSWHPDSLPRDILQTVNSLCGKYPVKDCDRFVPTGFRELRRFYQTLIEGIQKKEAVSLHFLTREPWELFVTVFGEPHCAGHNFWHLMDPAHPRYDPESAAALGDAILNVYTSIDKAIGNFIKAVPDAAVVVFSPEGMGPNYTGSFLVPEILRRLEMAPSGGAIRRWSPSRRWGPHSVRNVRNLLPRPLIKVIEGIKHVVPQNTWISWKTRFMTVGDDWSRSRAFCVPSDFNGFIRLNVKGREPKGLVERGAPYDTLCEELTKEFSCITNADTGEPAVQEVLRLDRIHQGEYLDHFPDLVVKWKADVPIRRLSSPNIGTVEGFNHHERSGSHRPYGFVIAAGESFQKDAAKEEGHIIDIAPTILHLMRQPVPKDMDGRVLYHLLAEDDRDHAA